MWIRREIEPLLIRTGTTRPAVLLTGARQAGKTSLIRRLFPSHGFVTLDPPSERDRAERDPSSFLSRNPPPVIIDEAQYAPSLFPYIKIAIDQHGNRYGQFLLTGSHSLQLMKSASEVLADRSAVMTLEPLSFSEAKAAVPELSAEDFLVRSGFPELYANFEIDPEVFLASDGLTILERDFRQRLMASSLADFERFMRACALRSGQLLNRSELARDLGITNSTDGEWLSVLQASYQLLLLEPWFSNQTKSLVKRPKVYSRDGVFHLADAKWSEQPGSRDAAAPREAQATLPLGSLRTMSVICRTNETFAVAPNVAAQALESVAKTPHWSRS